MKLKNILGSVFKKSLSFTQIVGLGEYSRSRWSKTDQLNAYTLSAYVYSCVRLRAEKVGEVDFQLHKGDVEIENHDILNLLYKPNPFQNKNEFFENYQMHKDLTGSVFVYMLKDSSGKIRELHLLRPDKVTILMDKTGAEIIGYKYTGAQGQELRYKPDEILFSLSPSPFSPLQGLSPLDAGQRSVDTELQLTEYQSKVLKNGGRIEGVFSFKTERMTEDQKKAVQNQFKTHYSEAKNAGKPLVLAGDATYQNLGLTPTEMSYLESKRMTRDDILLLYRIPKPLLAQTDDVNLASAKMAKSIFLSETIKPLLSSLTQKLNEFMVPEDLNLTFIDPTPEDVELELKKIESGLQNSYMTINEARQSQGLDPVSEGNSILVPFSLTPLEATVAEEPEMPEEPEEEPEDDDEDDDEQKGVKKKEETQHPLKDKETRAKYYKNWIKKADKREAQFKRLLNIYWKAQRDRMIEKLEAIPKQRRKGLLDDLWETETEVQSAEEWVLPVIRDFLVTSGAETMRLFGTGGEFSLTSTLQATLSQRAALFARTINETTFKRLQQEFAESVENQENRKQLIARIENTYQDISKARAATIARTEVVSASQLGVLSGYEQSGLEIKIWVATPDGNTRDSHAAIDGEEKGLHQPFSNGLQFPGDPTGQAEEVINCRCTI